MTIEYFFQAIGMQNEDANSGGADSITDQLNSRHTPSILITICILSVAKYFIEVPVYCWCPPEFTPSMVIHANTVSLWQEATSWTINSYISWYTYISS